LVLGFWFLVSGFWFLDSSTSTQDSGSWISCISCFWIFQIVFTSVGEVYSIADKPPFVFHAFGNSRFCVMAEFVDFGFWEFGNLGFSIFQFAGFLL